jgi:hypothetical protein
MFWEKFGFPLETVIFEEEEVYKIQERYQLQSTAVTNRPPT